MTGGAPYAAGLLTQDVPPERVLVEFGARVRARRQELGLSLTQVADMGPLSAVSVASYERGERNPTLERVWVLADMLSCRPADLLPLAAATMPAELDVIEQAAAAIAAAVRKVRAAPATGDGA